MLTFFRFLITKSHYLKRNRSLSSDYFNVHVLFKTSCELASSFKIKMQMYKLLSCIDTFQILFITTSNRKIL